MKTTHHHPAEDTAKSSARLKAIERAFLSLQTPSGRVAFAMRRPASAYHSGVRCLIGEHEPLSENATLSKVSAPDEFRVTCYK